MANVNLTEEELTGLIKYLRVMNLGAEQQIKKAEALKAGTPEMIALLKGDLERRKSALKKLEAAAEGAK